MTNAMTFHNGRIWTGDAVRPWAESVTIDGGRFVAIDNVAKMSGRVVDLQGRVVTPGLIDAHLHLLMGGQSLAQVDLSAADSREAFSAAILERHLAMANEPEQWIIAQGWSQENWPSKEMPTKAWIPDVGARPVVCYRMDRHAALVNDAVMGRLSSITEPMGGVIVRDKSGAPTGLFIEAAAWQLVNPMVPELSVMQRRDALRLAMRHANRFGITAVGAMEYARDVQEVYEPLRDELTLRCMITILDRPPMQELNLALADSVAADERLAIIGFKSFLDGTLGSATARMLADYTDDPGNRGTFVELAAMPDGAKAVRKWVAAVAEAGLSPSMHAIGDEAARVALDVAESLGRSCRTRIEHAQQLHRSDIARFKDRIASMQPLHKADDGRYAERRVGQERLAGTFAFRKLLNAGAVLAFGSDWPVVSCDPMLGIRAAVTGLTLDEVVFLPEENLTVEEAMRAYTKDAAFVLGMNDTGVIREGAMGDLVVFDADPFAADWKNAPPSVALTVVGGEIVHEAMR